MKYINETTLCEIELADFSKNKKGEVSKIYSYVNRAQEPIVIKTMNNSFHEFMTTFAKSKIQAEGTDEYIIVKEFKDYGGKQRVIAPIRITKHDGFFSIDITNDNTKLQFILHAFDDFEQNEIELLLREFSVTCEELTEDNKASFWQSNTNEGKCFYCYCNDSVIEIIPYFLNGKSKVITIRKINDEPGTHTRLSSEKKQITKDSFKFYLTDAMQNVFEYIENEKYYYNGGNY